MRYSENNIYLLRSYGEGDTSMVKLGYSAEFSKRINTYKASNPLIEVIGTWYHDEGIKFEQSIHSSIPSIHGREWYSEDTLKEIMTILNRECISLDFDLLNPDGGGLLDVGKLSAFLSTQCEGVSQLNHELWYGWSNNPSMAQGKSNGQILFYTEEDIEGMTMAVYSPKPRMKNLLYTVKLDAYEQYEYVKSNENLTGILTVASFSHYKVTLNEVNARSGARSIAFIGRANEESHHLELYKNPDNVGIDSIRMTYPDRISIKP